MGLKECVREVLYRDVSIENETKRAAVILRFATLIICCYFFLTMLAYVAWLKWEMILLTFPCLIFFVSIFFLTYKNKAAPLVLSLNAVTIVMMLAMVYLLGWDCGVQHFVFVLIVINFTTGIRSICKKICGAVALSLLRIAMYVYSLFNVAIMPLTLELKIILQVLNTMTICAVIIASLLLYTKDSRKMEEKLIVYNEKLQHLASIDPLTKLSNRRYVAEYMKEKSKLYECGRYNAISIAIADIDFFKKINDAFGHECGDKVLEQLSKLFENYMKDIGIVGRWGGEEFLFVFINENGDEAYAHLMNIQQLVKKLEFQYNNEKFIVSLTYGLTEYDHNKSIEMIIKEADDKLYVGKQTGRNRVVY